MERYKKSDIEFIDVVSSGTAASFIGRNKITGKKGIYKDNGCMLEITNEDIREKLASQIITEIGGYCAQIDLVYDEELGKNACFSNYIIGEDENLILVKGKHFSKHDVEDFISSYIESVKEINEAPAFLKIVNKDLCRYIYVSCLLDSYDFQTELIENKNNGEVKISPWFDFGVAFVDEGYHRKVFFKYSNSDEILKKLFENHYEEIEEISNNVKNILTTEKINELFYQDYIENSFEKSELDRIKNRFISQVEKSNELREEKIKKIENGDTNQTTENELIIKIKNIIDKIKQKVIELKNKINGNLALPDTNEIVNEEKTEDVFDEEYKEEKDNVFEEKYKEFEKENLDLTNDLEETISNMHEENRIEELIHRKYEEGKSENKEKKEIE